MEHFSGGGLKLKGIQKPKKKKKEKKLQEAIKESLGDSSSATSSRQKTEAELRFEEAQRKRLESKIDKYTAKSHKERVQEYNAYLGKLSEHHDIPKVGPG